jgi:2-polyprenyl-3-methyl-5-hydroxy-6-metoxy-1,4-benzoquinol methylase
MTTHSGDGLLGEQIEYYRARAPEYDRWFLRQGRYDHGDVATSRWFAEVEEVRTALSASPIDGADVLELAAGTGIWTEQLVGRAAHLTAVDASVEMISLNRQRLGARADDVSYVAADLFAWKPDHRFDAVVFCFWVSHIPVARIDGSLATVASMLHPGGHVFFVDGRREPSSTAADHILPNVGEESMVRRLDDGREFHIVKNFWDAAELAGRCRKAGLDVDVRETATYFQYGFGVRR